MQSPVWSHDKKSRLGLLETRALFIFMVSFLSVCGVTCDLDLCSVFFQHHCRACGQIFCGKCSSKYSTIPKFGIEKEVRVCEPCFELLNK